MKKYILIIWLFLAGGAYAQELENTVLKKPSEGKSMVYIARKSAMAPIIKFGIYDGEVFLGKIGAKRYFAYECDPGEHVFVAKSENTSYVEANLEAGRIYVLETLVRPGIAVSQVNLRPLDKSHKKYDKERERFLKFIVKGKGELLVGDDEEESSSEVANDDPSDKKVLKRYYKLKDDGKKITTLSADMHFEE